MPNTARGLTYPDSSGHTRLWEHLQELADDVEAMLNRPVPMCRMEMSADQIENNSTLTTVDFGTGVVAYDTDTMADPANDRLVIKTPGYYVVSAGIGWSTNSTGYRALLVHRARDSRYVAQLYQRAADGAVTFLQLSTEPVLMELNDTLQLRAVQTGGVALTLGQTNNTRPWLAARFVAGPTGQPIEP